MTTPLTKISDAIGIRSVFKAVKNFISNIISEHNKFMSDEDPSHIKMVDRLKNDDISITK